jgi:leader peptidase (prepilin peptidase)/N-methyltransferase
MNLFFLPRGTFVHKGLLMLALAMLWAVAGWQVAIGRMHWWWLPVPLLVAWLVVALTVVDLRHRRLPNALTLPAYPAIAVTVALASTQAGWQLAENALLGATILGTCYLAIHVVSPSAMGAGDVKLSGTQGAVMGAMGLPAVAMGTALAALLTLLLPVVAPKHVRRRWRSGIPHGPALLTATYVMATFSVLQPSP